MKKILILIIIILSISGCKKSINTPTSRVEEFLKEYQTITPTVRERLKNSVKNEELNSNQKEKYISLLEKQYQNLSYKIVNEEVNNDKAVVDVEIEVLNYSYEIAACKKYYLSHKDEIPDYNDYMLKELEKVTDKIKYKFSIDLTMYDGVWELDEIDNSIIQKIHGLF